MLVCHCHRVNDRTVRAAIRDGARCAESVGRACGAGTGCGGCVPAIDELLTEEAREHSAPRFLLPLLPSASSQG